MKTQVAIIGAGPAGLMLGHLLRAEGIDVVVVERSSPDYVLGRIRAGVLERTTTYLMDQLGLGARMHAEGLPHDGFHLADGERMIRIDIGALTGRQVMVYGQTEITRDLMEAAPGRDLEIVYDAADVALHGLESDAPCVTYSKDGAVHRIDAQFISGCDGYHGPSRKAILASVATAYEKIYPFGWLGILADVPPAIMNSSTLIMNGALRWHRCVRKSGAAIISRCQQTRQSNNGRTINCGMSWQSAWGRKRPHI